MHFDKTEYTGHKKFNWCNEEGYEGIMETYPPYLDRVKGAASIAPKHVWTVVDGSDGKLYIKAGFHIVDRVHFFVSNEPWDREDEIYEWS